MKKFAMLAAAVAMSMGAQAAQDSSDITVNATISPAIEITGLADSTSLTLNPGEGDSLTQEHFTVASNVHGGEFTMTINQ